MAVPLAKAGLSATGSFDFTYRLNAKDNSIYSVVGEVELQTGKKNRVIAFECYEQES